MSDFLSGAMAMACWTVALFFLRFWRETADRLFAFFAIAFLLLGGTRLGLALSHEINEAQTYLHWIRFVAFLVILAAIIDKNRR
jgi:ABC-type Na+ efflux pump permease subunit